jgi:hypothetical protein
MGPRPPEALGLRWFSTALGVNETTPSELGKIPALQSLRRGGQERDALATTLSWSAHLQP